MKGGLTRKRIRSIINAKSILTLILLLLCVSLAREAQAFYNPSTGRWLSRDPIGEKGGLNEYGFVSNNPMKHFDKIGLAYICENARVYIFVTRQDQRFDKDSMLRELRQVPAVTWQVVNGNLPAGSLVGPQGGSCGCLYFLTLEIKDMGVAASSGEEQWFHGNGNSWEAWVAPDRIETEFWLEHDNSDLVPANWENKSANLAWLQVSGFTTAHEVFHAIGVPHTTARPNILMTSHPTWQWLNLPIVPIDRDTVNYAEDILRHYQLGNVTN